MLRGIAERVQAYLVGGAIRDLLLGVDDGPDLDVAIEGEVDALSDMPGFEPEREGLFLTGRLELDGIKVDVARARAESYPQPGALPEVRPATIEEDLARRDFTVNAMAFPLAGDRTELIDPHGAVDDLRAGHLRVLHERSFVDDPTRALRAARYAARLGFELEPGTAKLLERTDLSSVSDDRVQAELRRIAAEDDPGRALRLIVDWGVMPALDPAAPDRVAEVARLGFESPWSGWADRELAVMLAITRPLPQIRELAAATPERPSEIVRLAEPWDPAQLAGGPRARRGMARPLCRRVQDGAARDHRRGPDRGGDPGGPRDRPRPRGRPLRHARRRDLGPRRGAPHRARRRQGRDPED